CARGCNYAMDYW
nr:immunoglobulin heavy chain junction region [Mus musculus]